MTVPEVSDEEKNRTFVFKNCDHYLADALCSIIFSYENVVVCGYSITEAQESTMHFRIQMEKGSAEAALRKGLEQLLNENLF